MVGWRKGLFGLLGSEGVVSFWLKGVEMWREQVYSSEVIHGRWKVLQMCELLAWVYLELVLGEGMEEVELKR